MRCICNRACFIGNGETKPRRYNPGMIDDFEECPTHFTSLDKSEVIDFLTAGFNELQERDWSFEDANTAISEKYNIELTRASKVEVVNQILDIIDRNPLQPVIPPPAE